ncbi:MAG: hypothetical protein ACLR4A_08460, partial [Christensenellales bacterium]
KVKPGDCKRNRQLFLTAIPQTLTDATHRLVYLIDTINGKEQILNNYDAQRDYELGKAETSHHFPLF